MKENIQQLIKRLEMQPHPEGGYYKETYRSTGVIEPHHLPAQIQGERNFSTCIYFMLTSENFSSFHELKQDEIWHFYDGSPIDFHMITPVGEHIHQVIGTDFEKSQVPQFIIPGGSCFAAKVIERDSYSLIGCTVSPGFSFEDFKLKTRAELKAEFPHHKEIIEQFTRG
jgi:predicted cupin superfamily sugar epimerase